jgi:hypothetical protein
MGERILAMFGVAYATVSIFIGFVLWFVFVGLTVLVVGAAIGDLWDARGQLASRWTDIAILLIFIRTLIVKRRIGELEEKLEHIRMASLATARYLDFTYGNERHDSLKGVAAHTKHGLWHLWLRITGHKEFADDILMASYAARDGRKVTLSDDLKSSVSCRLGECDGNGG